MERIFLMRRIATLAVVAAALAAGIVGVAQPASASTPAGGWVRSPTPPEDFAAGTVCAFPVHEEPIVDQVYGKTLASYPDGSPERQIYAGPLVVRVTNTTNGRYADANASGTALILYGTDGSQTWDIVGPVLINSRPGRGNLDPGVWVVNGVYTLTIPASGPFNVHLIHGTEHNVCGDVA